MSDQTPPLETTTERAERASDEAFRTTMQAEIRLLDDGFTLDSLKAHMKASRIPLDARLCPEVGEDGPPGRDTVSLVAQWRV